MSKFKKLQQSVEKREGYSPKAAAATAAAIARKKYGQAKLTKMSVAGKKKAAKKR